MNIPPRASSPVAQPATLSGEPDMSAAGSPPAPREFSSMSPTLQTAFSLANAPSADPDQAATQPLSTSRAAAKPEDGAKPSKPDDGNRPTEGASPTDSDAGADEMSPEEEEYLAQKTEEFMIGQINQAKNMIAGVTARVEAARKEQEQKLKREEEEYQAEVDEAYAKEQAKRGR